MTGGHGWQLGGCEADGPDEVRKAARKQIKSGADQVKLMATGGVHDPRGGARSSAQFTEDELRAGIEEAHKAGRKTATHAQGSQGHPERASGRIDSIEHGFYLTDEILELMVENGTAFVPTLSAVFHILQRRPEGRRARVRHGQGRKGLRGPQEEHRPGTTGRPGSLIGMGTDAGTPFNLHGNNAWELELMVEQGFSPTEALCAGHRKGGPRSWAFRTPWGPSRRASWPTWWWSSRRPAQGRIGIMKAGKIHPPGHAGAAGSSRDNVFYC